jgi:hypothetical protein
MFDREYIGAWDLPRDVTVIIARVTAGELVGEGGRKTKKPIVYFEGKDKGFAANKTNCKIIAGMYGTDTAKWIGKAITLYPTTTEMGGKTHDCIRVRPQIPAAAKRRNGNGKQAAPAEPTLEPDPQALEPPDDDDDEPPDDDEPEPDEEDAHV